MTTKAEILERLNEEQKEAVINYNGKIALESAAGSGKTRVLVSRIQYMIKDGIRPSKILAFTFTKKAANELKERVANAIGPDADKVTICTYHSFCGRILRLFPEYAGRNRNFSIYDEDEKKKILDPIIKKFSNAPNYSMVCSYISEFKLANLTPKQAQIQKRDTSYGRTCSLIYEAYEKELKKRNAFDFDDLPFFAYRITKNNPEVQEFVTKMYDYILSDENQDSNKQNLDFILLLGSRNNNIFVVGDTDQSIYGFRGADINNVLNTYKLEKFNIKYLSTNYRSSETIVDAAAAVISHNKARLTKTFKSKAGPGPKIKFGKYLTTRSEAMDIANEIIRLHNSGKAYKDIAILARIQSQTRVFEEIFLHKHIPFKLRGLVPFYSRTEIKDVLSYIKAAYNPNDLNAFERSVNLPKRGIGNAYKDKLLLSLSSINDIMEPGFIDTFPLSAKAKKGVREYAAIISHIQEMIKDNLPVADMIIYVMNTVGYVNYLEKEVKIMGTFQEKTENLNELIRLSYTYSSLEDFLNNAIFDDDVKINNPDLDNTDCVNVMTMHSSKGLEFDTVFLVGITDSKIPHIYSQQNDIGIEEERRLFYVAMTRAKQNLYITYPEHSTDIRNTVRSEKPSRFIKEIPVKYLVPIKPLNAA